MILTHTNCKMVSYDDVDNWWKNGRHGPDPRGPTPNGTVHWYYNYDEQRWVVYNNH